MKEHDRDGEDQERSIREHFEQPAARAVVGTVARLAAAGTFEINLLTAYRKNRDHRHRAENRSGIKNGASGDPIAEQTGNDRGEDITGMIEGLIAAYPQIQSPPAHDSQSHASDGRREECAHHTHGDLRGKNSAKLWKKTIVSAPIPKSAVPSAS